MSTLVEIEAAAVRLSNQEKQKLFLLLAESLRSSPERPLPEPRRFSDAEIRSWIDEDEADMQRLREGT